jgi:hypothetical protein
MLPEQPKDPAAIPTMPEAIHALERAAAAFEKAYAIADVVWRTNINNTERQQLRDVLRKSRRAVMRGDNIK